MSCAERGIETWHHDWFAVQIYLREFTVREYTDAAVEILATARAVSACDEASKSGIMIGAVQIRLSEFTVWDYTDGAVEPRCIELLVSVCCAEGGIKVWHRDCCAVCSYIFRNSLSGTIPTELSSLGAVRIL